MWTGRLVAAIDTGGDVLTVHEPEEKMDKWISVARRSLIEIGVTGLKVDLLAKRLNVTRGGFYHHFKNREDLLRRLLEDWEKSCRFLPDEEPPTEAGPAVGWLDRLLARHIEADGYDYQYDLAIREWARSDKRAEWAVERADRERLQTLEKLFQALGYDKKHAATRARVFYYHQIGFYVIGVKQSPQERRRSLEFYLDILFGEEALSAARAAAAEV
jgi:AcrR family transcriptional regulator